MQISQFNIKSTSRHCFTHYSHLYFDFPEVRSTIYSIIIINIATTFHIRNGLRRDIHLVFMLLSVLVIVYSVLPEALELTKLVVSFSIFRYFGFAVLSVLTVCSHHTLFIYPPICKISSANANCLTCLYAKCFLLKVIRLISACSCVF